VLRSIWLPGLEELARRVARDTVGGRITRGFAVLAASFNLGGWRFFVIVFVAGMPRSGSTFVASALTLTRL
jgi:hypothetical protein